MVTRSRSNVKTATLPYFSETTEAKITKVSTKVLYDHALHNIYHTMTLTEGQGKKRSRSKVNKKGRLPLFSETIKSKDVKFGTIVSFNKTLYNTC